jgi:hypothetical protein
VLFCVIVVRMPPGKEVRSEQNVAFQDSVCVFALGLKSKVLFLLFQMKLCFDVSYSWT